MRGLLSLVWPFTLFAFRNFNDSHLFAILWHSRDKPAVIGGEN